ncbi:MAG: ribonuclease H-like domain-containing protein [Anaerolineales bacterium]|nr:ribonuclease H-like domain-containing protein [Anaerolineales bacterium]
MGEQDRMALRRRLARLGGRRTVRKDGLSEPSDQILPPGDKIPLPERLSPFGPAAVFEKIFPFHTRHGHTPIGDLLRLGPYLNETLTGIGGSEGLDAANLVFLDTETTGLAGGAGTLAFLIGVGYVRQDFFLLRQYFLRSPGEEAAMLSVLEEDLGSQPVFVTYNGRTFDIPLLETRALVGLRKRWRLSAHPHIDLLHLTRRMWRKVLPDCRLSTVERSLLGVERTGQDIPGAEIPAIYLDYLQRGDTTGIQRVCYHNEIDILSLISLLIQLAERFSQEDLSRLPDGEVLALARWYERAGEEDSAEAALRRALGSAQDGIRREALQRFSLRMKREGRYEEAVEHWQEWRDLAPENPTPCLELAKYFEWHKRDYPMARYWAQEALVCLTHWPAGRKRAALWGQIEHRQKRLAVKAARESGG